MFSLTVEQMITIARRHIAETSNAEATGLSQPIRIDDSIVSLNLVSIIQAVSRTVHRFGHGFKVVACRVRKQFPIHDDEMHAYPGGCRRATWETRPDCC